MPTFLSSQPIMQAPQTPINSRPRVSDGAPDRYKSFVTSQIRESLHRNVLNNKKKVTRCGSNHAEPRVTFIKFTSTSLRSSQKIGFALDIPPSPFSLFRVSFMC